MEKNKEFELITDKKEFAFTYTNLLFGVSVPVLPSWNDILYKNPIRQSEIMSPTRRLGYQAAIEVAIKNKIRFRVERVKGAQSIRNSYRNVCVNPLTREKVRCLVLVFRPKSIKDEKLSDRRRDVYNPLIKGFIDGFTDAGVFVDDNELYHETLTITYAGLSDNPRLEVRFYLTGEINYDIYLG